MGDAAYRNICLSLGVRTVVKSVEDACSDVRPSVLYWNNVVAMVASGTGLARYVADIPRPLDSVKQYQRVRDACWQVAEHEDA